MEPPDEVVEVEVDAFEDPAPDEVNDTPVSKVLLKILEFKFSSYILESGTIV